MNSIFIEVSSFQRNSVDDRHKIEFENLSNRSWLNSYTFWCARDISEREGNLHTNILLTFVNFLISSSDSIRLSMRFIGWVWRWLRSFVPANKTICKESPCSILTNKVTCTINAAVKIITRFRQFDTRAMANLHCLGIHPVPHLI